MKIAFLSFYSGEVYRGVETYVHKLGNGLVQLGHQVTVFQNGHPLKDADYQTFSTSFSIHWNKPDGKFRFYTGYWARLIKDFTHRALDVVDPETDVIIPTNGGWQSLLCRVWAWRRGKKMVISGQSGPGVDDRLNVWLFPNLFIGLTNYQSQWAKSINPFIRVDTIPNGVDMAIFKPGGIKMELGLEPPVVLCVAALVPLKRLDLAIKAVAGLEKGSLVLVGRGELKEELQRLGNSLLPGRFQIMEMQHRDIHKVYRSADLFTFPTSSWESFGIAMLEAMASGLPVVANDDPIRREIVGDAGLFVDPTDTNAYTQALKEALSKKWGSTPHRQAEKFSWDDIAKKYEVLFEELVLRRNDEG